MKTLSLYFGPALAAALYLFLVGTHPEVALTAAIAGLCVIWWVFEPVPIPVTSLLPLVFFQASGLLSAGQVGQAYGSPLILLLLGGFILSRAMERSGAHRRLALYMVNLFGHRSSRQLVLGFMVTTALLSMWISNTATTLMMLPVALAVTQQSPDKTIGMPMMLGIAYAASIGGIGTPIGTPPNLVFMQVYEQQFRQSIGFTEWMRWGLPVVIAMIPLCWLWISRKLHYRGEFTMPDAGAWRSEEKRVLLVFALTALAWITRKEPFGGWSQWLNLPTVNDASVALLAVVIMFILPNGKGEKCLDWETAATIPWGILLLFGGGICLARAFGVSGLSHLLAENLHGLSSLPVILMIAAICLGVTFLTETTSNTASTVLLMPVLAATASGADIDARLLMVPAAISASCAFMMPVATAPNSIVFASGHFKTADMAREGLVLNLAGAAVITLICYLLL